MSNDARFWMWRTLTWGLVLLESFFVGQGVSTGFTTKKGSSHAAVWFALFFVACMGNVVTFIFYRKIKSERWQAAKLNQEKIEVETLAAYAKQQQAERQKYAQQGPPPKTS